MSCVTVMSLFAFGLMECGWWLIYMYVPGISSNIEEKEFQEGVLREFSASSSPSSSATQSPQPSPSQPSPSSSEASEDGLSGNDQRRNSYVPRGKRRISYHKMMSVCQAEAGDSLRDRANDCFSSMVVE